MKILQYTNNTRSCQIWTGCCCHWHDKSRVALWRGRRPKRWV